MANQYVILCHGSWEYSIEVYRGQETDAAVNMSEVFDSFTAAKTSLIADLRKDRAELARRIDEFLSLRKEDVV